MAQTWNDQYLIFNDSIIQESSGSPRWATVRIVAETSEVRKPFRSRPLWSLDLSNLLLTCGQYDELLAFQWEIEGMLNPFLVRNVRNCLFEDFSGKPSLLGIGNGTNKLFQLKKTRYIQGRSSEEIIKFPNIDYPALLDMNGNPWTVLPQMQIFKGGDGTGLQKGVPIPTNQMAINRNTGLIELAVAPGAGQRIEAYGGFFTLMICTDDEIPVKPQGATFRIQKGTGMTEPVQA